jgi:hypothetical protein
MEARTLALILLPALAGACGPEMTDGPHGFATSGDQGPGGNKDFGSSDAYCGGQQFTVQRVQPNVFLVVDRSGSMANAIAAGSPTKKWDDLKTAIGSLVSGFDTQIRLGMSLYNRDGQCAPGIIDTTLAPLNGGLVMSQLGQTAPGGDTPTAATLAYVKQNGGLNDTTRQNVVVLATDGKPNCNDTDVEGKITALYNATPSVKTFVIGLGSETSSNPGLLNAWAVAGHTERPGVTKYYQSNSATELQSAFQTIVGGLVSCQFSLSAKPPDPSQLYVWLGGQQVPLDAANGYSYSDGPPAVTLNGAVCDQLKADPNKTIQIVYGCPAPPPVL